MMYHFLFLLVVTIVWSETLVDLSHDYNNDYVGTWPGPEPFKLTPFISFTESGDTYQAFTFCAPEHSGTHMDAPSHFVFGKWTIDEIPLEHLIIPGVVMDIREKAAANRDYLLSTQDVKDWLKVHGPLVNKTAILVRTGWEDKYLDQIAYFGHYNDTKQFHFPGMDVGAAQYLVDLKESEGIYITGVGIDTASIDYGQSRTFDSHVVLSENNLFIIEHMKNLKKLPLTGFELTLMPMKMRGASGAPCRVVARISNMAN